MHQDYFKDKKVTVMGLGLLGRGLGDALYLAEAGAQVTVTDLKTEDELSESAAFLKPYANVMLKLGGHDEADFVGRDFILVAAGVPNDSEYLAHAQKHGVSLQMSGTLLAKLSGLSVIGVTGTRGKSTVTQLVHHTLQKAGRRALLGGNVRGVSNLQLLHEVGEAEVLVMELDSWQLQGWGWEGMSPHIAVFTNFMEDHLTYYNDMEEYFADKANIYRSQKPGDVLVASETVAKEWLPTIPPAYGPTLPEPVPDDWQLLIPGKHNRENAALAIAALKAFDVPEAEIKEGCETFQGVEGRLQYLKAVNDIEIYNDNNATTPSATVAALQTVAKGKNVVLICGGTDKGSQLDKLVEEIGHSVKQLVLYAGSGTETLKAVLPKSVSVEEYATLKECVAAARSAAAAGDIILFSPAFSSFGNEYKNEYDRNDQFLALAAEMK